jgi:hypothetical protein
MAMIKSVMEWGDEGLGRVRPGLAAFLGVTQDVN